MKCAGGRAVQRGEEEEGQRVLQAGVLTEEKVRGQAAATQPLRFNLQETHMWLDPGTSMLYLCM